MERIKAMTDTHPENVEMQISRVGSIYSEGAISIRHRTVATAQITDKMMQMAENFFRNENMLFHPKCMIKDYITQGAACQF